MEKKKDFLSFGLKCTHTKKGMVPQNRSKMHRLQKGPILRNVLTQKIFLEDSPKYTNSEKNRFFQIIQILDQIWHKLQKKLNF